MRPGPLSDLPNPPRTTWLGSIAKSGASPIVEVLSPAEKPTKHGLIYAATPASGLKEPYSDRYGFHNDMCIFNPAPIT